MHHLGIDVHKDESHVGVLDENLNLDELAKEYEGSQAAIEATGNYYTIYDTLNEYLDVVVADPQQTKAIGIAEVKNDRLDKKYISSHHLSMNIRCSLAVHLHSDF